MPWFAGVTREEIDRGSMIDPKKCVSCGLCLVIVAGNTPAGS
jgi:hypothetical protein